MNFNEWIEENGYCLADFCNKYNLYYRSTQNLKYGSQTPTLLNALKIYYISDKKVDLESMLSHKDKKLMKAFKKNGFF